MIEPLLKPLLKPMISTSFTLISGEESVETKGPDARCRETFFTRSGLRKRIH
jgi:hypothetical protein